MHRPSRLAIRRYQLKTECEPARSSNLAVVQSGVYSTKITALWHTGEGLVSDPDSPTTGAQGGCVLLSADYPGISASIQGGYKDYYAFVGFSPK
ncbi:hypothetical protein DL765_003891 [Monosporascus sp. GIB2]|nr:hypothetical protein DL765_003891 [Monosporascus sp. GIB2]